MNKCKRCFGETDLQLALCACICHRPCHQNGGEKRTIKLPRHHGKSYVPKMNEELEKKVAEILFPAPKNEGEKIDMSKVDPTIKRALDSLVCVGCGRNQRICGNSCGWIKPQPPAEDWEERIAGQLKLIEENRLGVERGESIDLQESLKNGLNKIISQLLKEKEDEGFVNRGTLEAANKDAIIRTYESRLSQARLSAFAEIEKFVNNNTGVSPMIHKSAILKFIQEETNERN